MRKVYADITIRAIITLDEGVEVGEVINEMDYALTSNHGGATIEDTEITNYEVVDSK